ncbi:MAG: recombinase family protein, partial [Shimia sp.]|nr:recombinase family protein [Shimia sp.]
MFIGYARVSTEDQSLALQHDALRAAGCERIFDDKVSGAKSERPGLTKALEQLRDGDTLAVWRLDRMGRSLKDLIARAEELKEMGVGLKSLQESIDTTSSGGQLIFHMFGVLAEFERNLIRERTQAGLTAARARGRKGGRKNVLDRKKRAHAVQLYHSREHTIPEICNLRASRGPRSMPMWESLPMANRGIRIPSETLLALRTRLAGLPPRSAARREEIGRIADLFGVSPSTVYRALKTLHQPKGLRRADRGKPRG